MNYRLRLHDEAIAEIREGFLWYESQRAELSDEFILEIEACLNRLSEHPLYYTQLHPRYRRILPERFPYQIFYEVEDDTVIVTRVRYEGRKPLA